MVSVENPVVRRYRKGMAKSAPKTERTTAKPPAFPALTKAQRVWVSARREELASAVTAGIDSGEKDGYRAFDAERILAFIEERRLAKSPRRVKRG